MRKLRSEGDADSYSPVRGGWRGGSDSSDGSPPPRNARTAKSVPPSRRLHNNANHDVDIGVVDPNTTETYMGEWKNDLRSGFG